MTQESIRELLMDRMNNTESLKEDKCMEQKKVDMVAVETKEEKDMAVETKVVESKESEDMVVEELSDQKVESEDKGVDMTVSVDECTEGEVEQATEVEKTAMSNSNLPVIQSTDKKAVLCVRDDYALVIMPMYKAENLVVESCKFYLEDLTANTIMVGAGKDVQVEKGRILNATDHGVMRNVNKFIVNFTDDDMKLAFERAKVFLENLKSMVEIRTSMTIQQAYEEVVRFAIEKATQEKGAKIMDIERKCKYDEKTQVVSIRDSFLQEVLDELGTGFTKTVFCKKLSMLEAHCNVQLMIRNKGRYACNEAGNVRFYKLKIVDELIGGAA